MYCQQWRVGGGAPRPPTMLPFGRGGGGCGDRGGRDIKGGGHFARNLGRAAGLHCLDTPPAAEMLFTTQVPVV